MSSKKYDGPSEGTRRSARVIPKGAASTAGKPATTKAPKTTKTSKKRSKAEVESEEDDDNETEEEEKPKAKKAKTVAKAKPLTAATNNEENGATASAGLAIGDVLSEAILKNEKDEDVNVKELAEKGLVMFVVPKADTPGCNNQACSFRDSYAGFTEEGYAVYGLSADKTAAQAKWQTKKSLPYPLLSDPSRAFIRAIGAGTATKTIRSHFIFEKGTGKLIDKKVPVQANKSSQLALDFLQGQKNKKDAEE